MPRVDFYLIKKDRYREQPLRLVCQLARKAYDSGHWTLVLARDAPQAETLDEMLWDMGEEAYIPHQVAGDEDDAQTPVLIATPDIDADARALVINLRDAPYLGTCERVLEVIPADANAREPQRQRWKHYQSLGYALQAHEM